MSFSNLPLDLFRYIIFIAPNPAFTIPQILQLRAVSSGWNQLLRKEVRTLVLRDDKAKALLDGSGDLTIIATNTITHLHLGRIARDLNDQAKSIYAQIAPVMNCLSLHLYQPSISILSLNHPTLTQLMIEVPGAEDRDPTWDCTSWIAAPGAQISFATKFPMMRSLHLKKVYPSIITQLSITPDLPPLKELCISLTTRQLESHLQPFCTILQRVSGSLETLCLEINCDSIINPVPAIQLNCLKQLSLNITGGQPLPFSLTTPLLEKLVIVPYSRPGLHRSGLNQVKIIVCDGEYSSSYSDFIILEDLYIDGDHLTIVKEYLVKNPNVCMSLRKIICTSDTVIKEVFHRNNQSIVISSVEEDSHWSSVFTSSAWACDGCDACHQEKKDH